MHNHGQLIRISFVSTPGSYLENTFSHGDELIQAKTRRLHLQASLFDKTVREATIIAAK